MTIDEGRLARAVHLDCERMTRETFRVSGGRADHVVQVTERQCECDCMDRTVRGAGCKHELCVRLHCGDAEVVRALRQLVARPRRLRRVA